MKNNHQQAILATTMLAFLSTGAHAASASWDTGWDTGWYMGVTTAYTNSNIDGEIGGPTPGGTFTDSYDANGGDFGLVYGFRYDFQNRFFLDSEAEFAWSSASETASIAGLSVNVDKNYSYGFNFKPGYKTTDKLALFATLGWKWSNYELEVVGVGSDDDTFDGFVYGAGAEYAFSKNVRASLEYNRVDYSSNTYNYGGGDYAKFGGEENIFKATVKYHF